MTTNTDLLREIDDRLDWYMRYGRSVYSEIKGYEPGSIDYRLLKKCRAALQPPADTREGLIEHLISRMETTRDWIDQNPHQAAARLSADISLLKGLEQQAQGGWISVKDRLPEIGEPVALIDVSHYENAPFDRYIYDCGYLSECGVKYWSIRGKRAIELAAYTHWQPLPPPPVQEEER